MDHVIPLIYDVTQRNWVTSVGGSVVQDPIEIGQMQSITFKVKFVKDGVQYALTTPTLSGGIKALNAVGAGYLLQFSTPTVSGFGPTTVYEFELLIDSSQLRAFIASYLPSYLGFSYALEIRDSFNNIATLPALSTKIYPDYTIVGTSPTTAVGTWNIAAGQTFTVNKTFAMPLDDGTAGFVLRTDGAGVGTWVANTFGSVTSVGQTFTGGIVSVGGSPVTSSGTLALTVAGTSGGIPYFSSGTTWATSAALLADSLVKGGGAGNPPSTITTGTGVLTALGNTINATGGIVTFSGNVGATTATSVNGNTITAGTGTLTLGVNTINLAAGSGAGSFLGGSINLSGGTGTNVSYSSDSGSINLSGGTRGAATGDAYGGSIDLSGGAGGDNSGGSIDLSGGTNDVSNYGGSINLSGGTSTSGAGNNYGGSINLSGGASGYFNHGGSIDLSGSSINNNCNGGSIDCSSNSDGGKGGSINLRSASGVHGSSGGSIDLSTITIDNGGSINASNGGGSIDTRGVGSIELGVLSTRTTLVGSATSGRTVTLPDATTTLAGLDNTAAFTNKTYNGHTFTAGSSTFTGTAARTYTFPSATTTIAGLAIAQTFTASQTLNTTTADNTGLITIKYSGTTKGLIGYRTTDLAGLQITGAAGSGGFQITDAQTRWFTNGGSDAKATLADGVGLSITGTGNGRNLSVAGTTTCTGGVIFGTFTVSTFPTTTYLEAVVTDALSPVVGSAVASGGSAKCKVMYNGSAKIVTAVL